jgi:molybdate transport system regulatory protein
MAKQRFDHLAAPLWLMFGGREFLMGKAIDLLRQIDSHGSLTKAAQAVPMSYKAAWDLIDKLNNISERPVVETATGGRNGGGTKLSDYGRGLLTLYGSLERSYQTAYSAFEGVKLDTDRFFKMVKGMCMKTSARNQLAGIVEKTVRGMISTEVIIKISGQERITAVVTNDSADDLGLAEGSEVVVLVDASAIILFPENPAAKCTAENKLSGKVVEVRLGMVYGEVIVELPSGKTMSALTTKNAVESLKIAEGMNVRAAFNSSQVILAIPM